MSDALDDIFRRYGNTGLYSRGVLQTAQKIIGNDRKGSLGTVRDSLAVITTAWGVYTTLKEAYSLISVSIDARKTRYTISIREGDIMFRHLMKWLQEQFPEEEFKSRTLETSVSTEGHNYSTGSRGRTKRKLKILPSDTLARTVYIEGHPITIGVLEEEEKAKPDTDDKAIYIVDTKKEYVLTSKTFEGYKACVRLFETFKHNMEEAEGVGVFVTGGTYGSGWVYVPNVPTRDLDTVVMDPIQKMELVEDIQTFLKSRENYTKLGLPWHRGYLLYGPPGTGKTSLVKALATHFDLDVFIIKPNDYDSETALERAIFSITPNSILLLEDIDTTHTARNRDTEENRVHFSQIGAGALLNAIDGIATPEGVITIMTSNHPEKLDEALVRSGRIDMRVEVGYLTPDTLSQLVEISYGQRVGFDTIRPELAPADVLDIVKRHIHDPETAITEIKELAYE